MSNKKITLFVMAMMLLIIGLSAVTASDYSDNISADSSIDTSNTIKESNINSPISTDTSNIKSDNNIDDTITCEDIPKEEKNIKKVNPIIITNQTFNTYFTDKYLNDKISPGDTLDFQGKFLGEEYSMTIDKPVNIITSTNDAYICVNTSSEDFSGETPVTSFSIINGGSYTNVTGIYFYNTQIFIRNATHVTINNISAIVENRQVGRGVGQTAIRDNSSFVTIENSTISTTNNGGSTSLALSWANNCTIRNNLIIGSGNVGNIFYLNTYNVNNLPLNDEGQIDYRIVNVNNTIENNILIGPETPAQISYGICLSGSNNLVRNNTINYPLGQGINPSYGIYEYDMNTTIVNNTLNGCNFNAPPGLTIINNTINGNLTPNENCIIENNTISVLKISKNNFDIKNNNISCIMIQDKKTNITIENCNITENITMTCSSRTSIPTDITITDNKINATIYINGSSNVKVSNNNMTEPIIIANRNNYNQNLLITNNTIITDKDYAIIVNTTVNGLNISDNRLKSDYSSYPENIYIKSPNDEYIINNTDLEDEIELVIKDISIEYPLIVNRSSQIIVNVTGNDEEVTGTITLTDGEVTSTSTDKTVTYTPASSGEKTLTVTFTDEKENSVNTTVDVTVYPIILIVDPIEAKVNQNINITARIVAGNTIITDINKGKVVFKVNGKTLKDDSGKVLYARVAGGAAIIENYTVPESWNKEDITIEAVYSGSTQQDALRSQPMNMTISKAEPKITTEDVTATIGSNITLKATVNDDNKIINSGKVIFKINGKTLKDDNGRVIYVPVTNNIANLNYTLPSSYKAKTYTLTAVLILTGYEKIEDNKTLTVTK